MIGLIGSLAKKAISSSFSSLIAGPGTSLTAYVRVTSPPADFSVLSAGLVYDVVPGEDFLGTISYVSCAEDYLGETISALDIGGLFSAGESKSSRVSANFGLCMFNA